MRTGGHEYGTEDVPRARSMCVTYCDAVRPHVLGCQLYPYMHALKRSKCLHENANFAGQPKDTRRSLYSRGPAGTVHPCRIPLPHAYYEHPSTTRTHTHTCAA